MTFKEAFTEISSQNILNDKRHEKVKKKTYSNNNNECIEKDPKFS